MKLSKIKTLCAAVGIACGAMATSAHAITFTNTPYAGYIDIDIFGYDAGTTGYFPTGYGGVGAGSGTSCSTVAGCDAAAGSPAPNTMIASEDTWGVLRVNEIRDLGGNILWAKSATEQLYGMFYGFKDKVVEWSTNNGTVFNFKAWSEGGTVKIWEHGAEINDFGDVLGGALGPANRTAADGYLANGTTQLNNGNLWLQLAAAAGQSEYAGTTLESGFTSSSASGVSDFYADVVGGSGSGLFYDDQPDENGVLRDFYIRNVNTINGRGSWTVRADTASSSAVTLPEPGSMALVGLGLLGLAGLRRRKAA